MSLFPKGFRNYKKPTEYEFREGRNEAFEKRRKKMRHNPDREELQAAMDVYFKGGGKITYLEVKNRGNFI